MNQVIKLLVHLNLVKLSGESQENAGSVNNKFTFVLDEFRPRVDDKLGKVAVTARAQYARDIYCAVVLGYASNGRFNIVPSLLSFMIDNNLILDKDIGLKLLKISLKQAPLSILHNILSEICKFPLIANAHDIDALVLLSGNLMKDITFVKGAVSVETLPRRSIPEIIFMGRSNVGKSSLINMITNRKQLAYTSKMAGKTTEFNYFKVHGVLSKEKEAKDINFYLVDLPGVGYARRSKDMQKNWLNLIHQYMEDRKNGYCKAIYHLVDSRHGILDADFECLDVLKNLPDDIEYRIVFTKIDKINHSATGGVSEQIYNQTKQIVDEITQGKRDVPFSYTSAVTRKGGFELLHSMLGKVAD
jgi:ribosome biogenesis GTP-binding protein YsxC/EngB